MAARPARFRRWLRRLPTGAQLWAIAFMLAIGLGFRLYGLDHKVYWHDEVFTSLRAAGYIGVDVAQQLLDQTTANQTLTAKALQQFQQLSPDSTWADTWAALKTHPEHPPLFYLMERAWMVLMGSSVAATRGLSALFGIALFPLVAWFCNDLGQASLPEKPIRKRNGKQTAAVAIALLAISPIQVLYAQEAREYSLWACEIVLASGLLWRAVQRPQSRAGWVAYSGAIALGLYTTLLHGLVIIAHGVFMLGYAFWAEDLPEAGRNPPIPPLPKGGLPVGRLALLLLPFTVPEPVEGKGDRGGFLLWLSAISIAILLFSPWVLVAVQESQKLDSVTSWTKVPLPIDILAKLWGLHLSASAIDFGLPLDHPYSLIVPAIALLLVGLCWLAVPQGKLRLFLLVLLTLPALLLILPDLVWGGQRSSLSRYFMPLTLAATVTLALGIAQGLRSTQRLRRLLCQLLLAGLLAAGTVSCYRSAIAPAWWNKNFNYVLPAMAVHIAEAQVAQVTPVWMELSGNNLGNAIALSHRILAETPFQFFQRSQLPAAPRSPVLIPYASGALLTAIQQTYGLSAEVVEAPDVYELWRLSPQQQEP